MYTRCPRRITALSAPPIGRQTRVSLAYRRFLSTTNELSHSDQDFVPTKAFDTPEVQKTSESSVKQTTSSNTKVKHGVAFYSSSNLNLQGMFALLRGVEKRFGSITDFRFQQDRDCPSDYLALFVNFSDPHSVQKLSELSAREISIQLPLGVTITDKGKEIEGGVGLSDISELLKPVSANDDAQTIAAVTSVEETLEDLSTKEVDDTTEVPSVSVLGAAKNVPAPQSIPSSIDVNFLILDKSKALVTQRGFNRKFRKPEREQIRLLRSFVAWGGFYPHNFSSQPSEDGNLTTENPDLHPATEAMRGCIYNARLQLHEKGDPTSGIQVRDGKKVVSDWEEPEEDIGPLTRDDTTQDASQVLEHLKESFQNPVTGTAAHIESVRAASGPLSAKEKATLERLFRRMNYSAQQVTESATELQEMLQEKATTDQSVQLPEKELVQGEKKELEQEASFTSASSWKSVEVDSKSGYVKHAKAKSRTPDSYTKRSERPNVRGKRVAKKVPKQMKEQPVADDLKSRLWRTFGFGS